MPRYTRKGIRLPRHSEPAASLPVATLSALKRVYLPLSYTRERVACLLDEDTPAVRGKPVSAPADGVAELPVLATVSGEFDGLRQLTHPLYGFMTFAAISVGESDTAVAMTDADPFAEPIREWADMHSDGILEASISAAIIDETDGQYLYHKLRFWRQNGCQLLIADGAANQSYNSSAWAVLNQSVEQVWKGLRLAAMAAVVTGMQINVNLLPHQIRPLRQRIAPDGQLYQLRRRYPAFRAAAPQMDGCTVGRIGIQACLALYRACLYGEPHLSGVVTVAGDAVIAPQNLLVPFGTTGRELFRFCGLRQQPARMVLGDVMTGFSSEVDRMPVLPGVTSVLAFTQPLRSRREPCCGCGRCIRACHAGLLPCEIVRRFENMQYDQLEQLHPQRCDGCGACSYICPSGRELTTQVLRAADSSHRVYLKWGMDDEI